MPTDFDIRRAPGELFEQVIMALLTNHPEVASVCANGTEHTHPTFVHLLRSNNSPAAKFVRYAPDGVVLLKTDDVIHFDAKCAQNIEKDAYEVYMRYVKAECRVMLFVKNGDMNDQHAIYYQDLQRIKLIEGEEIVARYNPEKRFPVIDGWVYPRKQPGFFSNGHMSGTPYKEIDFTSMYVFNQRQLHLFRQEQLQLFH